MQISNSFEISVKQTLLLSVQELPRTATWQFRQTVTSTKHAACRSCTQNTAAAKVQQPPCTTPSPARTSTLSGLQTPTLFYMHESLHQAKFTTYTLLPFLFLLHTLKVRSLSHWSRGGPTLAFELLIKNNYCPAKNCT